MLFKQILSIKVGKFQNIIMNGKLFNFQAFAIPTICRRNPFYYEFMFIALLTSLVLQKKKVNVPPLKVERVQTF